MVLKRPEICRLIGFNSWTAVQVWVASVVGPAHSQLVEGYLKPYEEMGKKTPKGNDNIKNYLVERALLLEAQVEKRVAELAAGIENNPSKIGCKCFVGSLTGFDPFLFYCFIFSVD